MTMTINFDILMTITLEVNMINKQMTHFSHLLFELYPLVYFIFGFREHQNLVSWGPPFTFYSCL